MFLVFCRQRSDRCQRSPLAFDDRPSRPSWQVDQEHGEGKQPLRHQVHRSG
jgi:hypothetical protein